jgi:hypothetical protein
MGGLVSYAETKRICIGLVHILNQRTQQSGYSGIVGSRQQQQAARFRTWGVPLYSSQGGSMVDGYAQAQQLAEERMLRQLREQASGYFPGVRQRVQSWMQVLWLRQPSRVKGWAPSGRVAGGSSAHTTRWGTVARVPSGGPENSSMWSGQHFSGRSCYPLRGRMGGLVGSSTHSSRCGKGTLWEGRRGVQCPHHSVGDSGPGPKWGAQEFFNVVRAAFLWERLLPPPR